MDHIIAGLAPQPWLVRERIERAKELLESTASSTERIAERIGIGSPESLRHHFRRLVGTTPARYRARFGRSTAGSGRTGSISAQRRSIA